MVNHGKTMELFMQTDEFTFLITENYDPMDIGHPGQQRMLELIKQNYQWLDIKENIKKYVQRYIKCQQNKVQHQRKAGELHLLKIPQGLWQEISIDIVEPLPKLNEKDAIIVIVDRFTKMI